MSTFYLKRHDTYPPLQATLHDDVGVIDLTNADTVTFSMWDWNKAIKVDRGAATIASAATGLVSYTWQSTDVDTAGRFLCEWEITWPGGKQQTVPSYGDDEVVISADGDNT